MFETMTLRMLSSLATSDALEGNEIRDAYLTRTTEKEVEQAYFEFMGWYEPLDESLPREESSKLYDIVWGYIGARVQHAHEAGVRTGIRLMADALTSHTPFASIEAAARERYGVEKMLSEKRAKRHQEETA